MMKLVLLFCLIFISLQNAPTSCSTLYNSIGFNGCGITTTTLDVMTHQQEQIQLQTSSPTPPCSNGLDMVTFFHTPFWTSTGNGGLIARLSSLNTGYAGLMAREGMSAVEQRDRMVTFMFPGSFNQNPKASIYQRNTSKFIFF